MFNPIENRYSRRVWSKSVGGVEGVGGVGGENTSQSSPPSPPSLPSPAEKQPTTDDRTHSRGLHQRYKSDGEPG